MAKDRRLISMTPTSGKSPEEVARQVMAALEKDQERQAEARDKDKPPVK